MSATEDASFRTVLEAVGTEYVSGTAKRIDLLAIAETDTGSSARLPLILNDLYGVSTYTVIISSPDGGNDRTGLIYDSSTLILLDHVELNSGLTHHTVRAMFGNDGTHTMGDAISSGTGATPMVLVALEENSHHLPVVVDYFVPLTGESSCSADMVVETNIRYKDATTISSEVGIVTSGTVVDETSATVRYYAPQIELAPGFQVESGEMFRAVIEAVDCSAFSP